MELEQFVDRVMHRGGLVERAQVERAIEATLEVLRERFVDNEAKAMADGLPKPLGDVLRAGRYDRDFDLHELYERVRQREGIKLGFAVEHAQVVCQVVAETLPDETLERVRKFLPQPIADLFTERGDVDPPVPAVHHAPPSPASGTTLASGRPGSRHPLSEAEADPAHTHSVARTDNPHADTKLSSSHGLTQERRHETLAEGKPETGRPISEG